MPPARSCPGWTARGRRQAQAVARYLAGLGEPVAALYTSPLSRTADTAAGIGQALGLVPRTDARLAEYDLGPWEGRTFRELLEVERFWERTRLDPDFAPEGAESPRQVGRRFAAAVRAIAAAHRGSRVVVVSHGGAISLGLGLLLRNEECVWDLLMDNCAVSELEFASPPHLRRFNLVAHLQDDALRPVPVRRRSS